VLTAKRSYGYGRGHRALEISSIVLFFAALSCLGFRTVTVNGAPDPWALGASVLAGFVAADFLSGVAHWAGDTVGDEETPLIGRHFVTPFRLHHVDPKAITRHDFVETNGNSCIASMPAMVMLTGLMPSTPTLGFYLSIAVASSALFVFCTNQFHKWAHADRPPELVRWLQRMRLILSPEHHAIHHAAPHDKYYCITVGWMNPLLTRVRFFRGCEAVMARLTPGLLSLRDRKSFRV
jgi:sterol desaturase/sphingolipid hydroxylase (fatty acid hydroxylase superfamily)